MYALETPIYDAAKFWLHKVLIYLCQKNILMTSTLATDFIKTKQRRWAHRNNIPLRSGSYHDYTKNVNDNIYKGLLETTKKEFSKGNGNELKGSRNTPPKICALHSSAALCVNVFQYWKNKENESFTGILNFCGNGEIKFEQKFEIDKRFEIPPNLDVVIKTKNNDLNKQILAIECKFSEPYYHAHNSGLEKYLKIPKLWEGLLNTYYLANEIKMEEKSFRFLDAAQLIKHILGLKNKEGINRFKLLYLWYDVPGTAGKHHKNEIDKFTKIVRQDGIDFFSLTYQEVILQMQERFMTNTRNILII